MNPKNKSLVGILISITIFIPLVICANGGIYYSVEIPQSEDQINIPHQKAIIFWDDYYKKEVILLSTEIKTGEISDLAWVIPVPSETKPEVEEAEIEIFDAIPWLFSDIKRISRGGGIIGIIILAIIVPILLFWLLRKKRTKLGLISGAIGIVILMFFISIIFVSLGGARSGGNSEVLPIEIIETKKVGIYDVIILKSTDASFMVNWLNENGYKVSDKSTTILQEYCSQPNSYFIVNRINKEALDEKDLSEGIATPLEIKFQPEKPFYPMKLSSINGGETLIDIYFFSSEPVGDESGLLKVKKSRNIRATGEAIRFSRNEDARKAFDYLQNWPGDIDYDLPFMFSNVGTWLQYEGNLSNLQKDSYFSFETLKCDDLPGGEADWLDFEITSSRCYEMFAKERKDISFCEKATDSSVRDDCYNYFASANNDPSLCEKISNKSDRYSCYVDFAKNVQRASTCEEKPISQLAKDVCYRVFSSTGKDSALCEKINNKKEKEWCYRNVAVATENTSLCKKIRFDRFGKDKCYWDIAIKKSDDSLCEKVSGGWRDSCYGDIATQINNVSLCEKITDKDTRENYCYRQIAINTKDKSLCDRITNERIRKSCYESIKF